MPAEVIVDPCDLLKRAAAPEEDMQRQLRVHLAVQIVEYPDSQNYFLDLSYKGRRKEAYRAWVPQGDLGMEERVPVGLPH